MKKRPLPPLFLREKHLEDLFPFSHAYLCELRSTGEFPAGQPLVPGSRARVWTWTAIREWLEKQLGSDHANAVLADYLNMFFGVDETDVSSIVGRPASTTVDAQRHQRQSSERDPVLTAQRPGQKSAKGNAVGQGAEAKLDENGVPSQTLGSARQARRSFPRSVR